MIDVSDYDKFDYDYSTYWKERGYENNAEKIILNKIFQYKRGDWFVDIGGSYGRLTSTYYDQYKNPIIVDYSLKTLQRNYELMKSKYPNATLIAANAYKLPFKESTFDASLMVRVLHHIEKPEIYLKEMKRVLKNNSLYVQEYANKIHIKARIKAIIKRDFSIFSKEPYKQPTQENLEGSSKEERQIFYNYHPAHIKSMFEENGFTVKRKHGCSFLRSQIAKKLVSENILVDIERFLQATLSWSNIPPSIILETKLKKKETKEEEHTAVKDILVCPSCKDSLSFENDTTATCKKCKTSFYKKESVWDFRVK